MKVLTPELPGSMSTLRQIFVKVLMFAKETPYQKKFCSTHSLPPKAINQSINSLTEKGLTQHKLNNLCACANLLCISHSSTYHAIQNHSGWKTVGLNQLSLSCHINIPCNTESLLVEDCGVKPAISVTSHQHTIRYRIEPLRVEDCGVKPAISVTSHQHTM